MPSVKHVRVVAKGKARRPTPESLEQRAARFAESTLLLFVDAFRAGKDIPNRDTVHKRFYEAAKVTRKWSDKGNKAWASLQVEELRRTAVARVEAESNGSAVA
jgi:hypothetical protein